MKRAKSTLRCHSNKQEVPLVSIQRKTWSIKLILMQQDCVSGDYSDFGGDGNGPNGVD
jgi:hypothetical protein